MENYQKSWKMIRRSWKKFAIGRSDLTERPVSCWRLASERLTAFVGGLFQPGAFVRRSRRGSFIDLIVYTARLLRYLTVVSTGSRLIMRSLFLPTLSLIRNVCPQWCAFGTHFANYPLQGLLL